MRSFTHRLLYNASLTLVSAFAFVGGKVKNKVFNESGRTIGKVNQVTLVSQIFILFLLLVSQIGYSQNAIVGTGFSPGWGGG